MRSREVIRDRGFRRTPRGGEKRGRGEMLEPRFKEGKWGFLRTEKGWGGTDSGVVRYGIGNEGVLEDGNFVFGGRHDEIFFPSSVMV